MGSRSYETREISNELLGVAGETFEDEVFEQILRASLAARMDGTVDVELIEKIIDQGPYQAGLGLRRVYKDWERSEKKDQVVRDMYKSHSKYGWDEYAEMLTVLSEKLGITYAQFSAYPVVLDVCYDVLDDVAVKGDVVITAKAGTYWDPEGEGEDYRSGDLTDPTWKDLWLCAEAQIKSVGDKHHVFLEAVTRRKDGTYELVMGS